jgi:hypothetical protein
MQGTRDLSPLCVTTRSQPMTSTEFGKLIAGETEKWAKVVKAANIKPE